MGRNISAILFISGVALIFFALVQGEAKAGFFVIFPYISGSGIFTAAGIFLIMASIGIFIFFSLIQEDVTIDHQADLESKKRGRGNHIYWTNLDCYCKQSTNCHLHGSDCIGSASVIRCHHALNVLFLGDSAHPESAGKTNFISLK